MEGISTETLENLLLYRFKTEAGDTSSLASRTSAEIEANRMYQGAVTAGLDLWGRGYLDVHEDSVLGLAVSGAFLAAAALL